MDRLKIVTVVVVAILVASCGSRKASPTAILTEDAAAVEVISNHYTNEADFETLQGRLRVRLQTQDRNQAATVSFRMKKNDTIWMSGQMLGITLAKVMITQDRVQFYEKIRGSYFDGDFRLLSNLLGTPLDFEKVQNLLIGQTIYSLRDERYMLTESTRGYQLVPEQEQFLKKMFLLDPVTYKATAQQIAQEGLGRSVTVTYPSYQKIEEQEFPKEIKVIANEADKNTQVDMEFRSVSFNVPVSFPFSIPSGYEEIVLE